MIGTIYDFWKEQKYEIANWRGWECKNADCPNFQPKSSSKKTSGEEKHICKNCSVCPSDYNEFREKGCNTLQTYDTIMGNLDKNLHIPMTELNSIIIYDALEKTRREGSRGKEYSEKTMDGIKSRIRTILGHAENCGVAYNVLKWDERRKNMLKGMDFSTTGGSTTEIRRQIEATLRLFVEKNGKPRSLKIKEIEKLVSYIEGKILEDGRYLALLLALYMGLRPAECRGLFWRNVKAFIDHPDRLYLQLYRTRSPDGTEVDRMKTVNGFRKIPVHIELLPLLLKRMEFVGEQWGGDIADLPVCCIKNRFNTPCRDIDFATVADTVLNDAIHMREDELNLYDAAGMLEELSELEETKKTGENHEKNSDCHLTLYVLRRNFWTTMISSTRLSDYEKRYLIKENRRDMRPRFNDEELLWIIQQKMDCAVFHHDSHLKGINHLLDGKGVIQVENRGAATACILEDFLRQNAGKKLRLKMRIRTREGGDSVSIMVNDPWRGKVTVGGTILDYAPQHDHPEGINCEGEILKAHSRYSKLETTRLDEKEENTGDEHTS